MDKPCIIGGSLLHVLCRFRHRKNFFFHCYHSYLYFVQVSLVSMPQVMKVDSVWTTLVETPHPSLKTKDKILLVLYLRYLLGNLKSQSQPCEVTHQRWGNLPVHVISHFNLIMFTCRWGDPPRWNGWSARPDTLLAWVKFCQVNVSRWGTLPSSCGLIHVTSKSPQMPLAGSFASLKVKAMQHLRLQQAKDQQVREEEH